MSTLQETPTPALVIHRHGSRQYCVLPGGIDPESDEAKGKHLLISSRKACESYVNERQALAEAQAAAAPPASAVTRVDRLPVIEIQHVEREGHYVLVNQKQVARFDGPTAYDDATRCCAVLVQNEIAKLGQQQPQQAVQPPEPVREPKVEPPELAELAEHEAYRRELVERARKAYPNATPELAARIDKEITRRVECVRTYQAHLDKVAAENFPNATAAEKAAQPWRDDAVGLGEVLEERDGGRRVIGEAVEEEERARVDRAADERVNLAERQRERGAGQPLTRCVHKSDQRQVEPAGHGYNERRPHG